MGNTWNKEELELLYETHTLEEIGQKYGVSRERIRQVMDKFKIKRRPAHTVKDKSANDLLIEELKINKSPLMVCPACNGNKTGSKGRPCWMCQ